MFLNLFNVKQSRNVLIKTNKPDFKTVKSLELIYGAAEHHVELSP